MNNLHKIKKYLGEFDYRVIVLIISVSAVLAYVYFDRVDRPNLEVRFEMHNQIISGQAPSPYLYRILVPFTAELLYRLLLNAFSSELAFLLSYATYNFLAILFFLIVLFLWLRVWFSKEQGLIGLLYTSSVMPIALKDHDFQPWSLLETALFTAALIAIHKEKYLILIGIIIAASLNRETALFIPVMFLLKNIDFQKKWKNDYAKNLAQAGGLLLIWAAIFLSIRWFQGNALHIVTFEELMIRNTSKAGLMHTLVNGSLFLGGFWFFVILGFGYAPRTLRKMSLVVPFYLTTIIVWGVWHEVRLLMPLYPIFLPLGLSYIYLRLDNKDHR